MAPNALTRLSQRTPLRVKLITALLALLALALAVISFTSVAFFRGYLVNQSDSQLRKLITAATNQNPGENLHQSDLFALSIQGYLFEVLDQQGNPVMDLSNSPQFGQLGEGLPVFPTTSAWLRTNAQHPVTVQSAAGSEDWRLIEQPIGYFENGQPLRGTLVVATNMGSVDRTVGFLTTLDVVVSLIIMLGLAVVSVAVVRTNLRPLDDIEETAEDIAAGHLERRVPDRDPGTEVGRLGRSINTMLAQIETAFHAREESEEAAVQSEERMRRFIADASHELRTPLTAIRGFAEYYRQRGGVATPDEGNRGSLAPADLDRIMQRVEGEAGRMGVLVEDLLLLARLDQQRPIEHRPVDLLVLAADAAQDTRMIAPGRPVRLDVEPGKAFLITGDEARLRQVIGNLMTNALTHTGDGTPIEVRLRSGFLPGPAPYPGAPAASVPAAVLEVADQGQGLTPEQTQRVFERFYRADQARNRRSGGSGLGLAIVSALVAAHGGSATVESAPGQGATFRITLPLAPDAAAGEAEPDDAEPTDAEPTDAGQPDTAGTITFGS